MGGGKGLRFAAEVHVKALSNRTIDMLKTFPGFCEWWFGMDEGQRSFIFEDLHLVVLGKFIHLTGLVEERAEQMRDCVINYFDSIPGFTQWKHTVAGADLRGRVQYQLKDHLWEQMRKGYS
jgi:hypothetical protein